MNTETIYRALDIKNRRKIQAVCPEIILDGMVWYDTSEFGFFDEKLYLQSRGLIVIFPTNFMLVRFKEEVKPEPDQSGDAKRLLRST